MSACGGACAVVHDACADLQQLVLGDASEVELVLASELVRESGLEARRHGHLVARIDRRLQHAQLYL